MRIHRQLEPHAIPNTDGPTDIFNRFSALLRSSYPKLLNGMNEESGANQYAEMRYGTKKAKQPFTDYLALVGTIGLEPMTSAM